ncbi:hypothetical protein K469DRAFT_723963 [Zopfia rhizophila CBS 207.26]|uniref:Nuclear pore complex protein Nup85 n=1 Tax=Zopfia rhizophila CBS 207.26 TaxID=1314779 RepID=A0A6A6EEG7_9PEZI|nr:hypothetical protein K469DRAFT_723963 [Zopfia rhizophila CBS 207.26]
MFRVPSSTPPSTPDSRRSSRHVPSTTPAGLPPDRSFIPSSTPAGPPPSGLFGGSHFKAGDPKWLFNKSPRGGSPDKNELSGVGSGLFGAPPSARSVTQRGRSGFRVPSSSPPQPDAAEEDDDEEDSEREEKEEDEDEEGDDNMEDDEDAEGDEDDDDLFAAQGHILSQNRFSQSAASRNSKMHQQPSSPPVVRPAAKQSQYDLFKLAKGLTPNADRVTLRGPDEIILETEHLMTKLHESVTSDMPEKRSEILAEVAQELVQLWRASSLPSLRGSMSASSRPESANPLANANRLANLLLNIHYPAPQSRQQRPSVYSLVSTRPESRQFTPIPKVLLEWMNTYHNNPSELGLVLRETRGFSAHAAFWDAVNYSAFRGNFSGTLKLLKGARFEVAETAAADGLGDHGYHGIHLTNTNIAVESAIHLLHACPAVNSDDWDVKGQDWSVFRRRVYQTLAELQDFAEGQSQNRHSISQPFQAANFGISQSQNNLNLSMASRRAESNVPWTVYENLSKLYKQLLGGEEEIIAISSDWVEAVLGLAVWWNGEDDDVAQGSLAASRRSIARSQRVRPADVTPVRAYCQRLSSALATVINTSEDFSINTTDASEVGLACIFDDNTEGVLQILRNWSLSIASAVAEVASAGEWFRLANGILDQFDQSDLMVLSFNEQQRTGVTKDDLLTAYAILLSSKETITSRDGQTVREGWELSIQVLERLDDESAANDQIDQLLHNLPLQSPERVDKITYLCNSLGLSKHARSIALKYADYLSKSTQNYGDTLVYYARAHDATMIQEVLQILVSHCLVKSMAFPPFAELDTRLKSLITSPKHTLTQFARVDPEAAQLLSNYLSGYATIRKFYDLRDEEILAQPGEKPTLRPMARKRAAANALMVIIASASSSIRGGLYDPDVETVVQVDVLLSLLGEALVFVNQPKRTLTLQHLYSLLAAIEDLETAPSMIFAQCEECFSSTLAAAHGANVPSSLSRSLHKSTSNLTTASSQYSLIGSQDLGSLEGQSTESSAVLIKGGNVNDANRAWDWRKGFGKEAKGSDVLRILRLGIAREIGRAWAEGEV